VRPPSPSEHRRPYGQQDQPCAKFVAEHGEVVSEFEISIEGTGFHTQLKTRLPEVALSRSQL
jgi:hypothetical protein